jgi:hypothetical protein
MLDITIKERLAFVSASRLEDSGYFSAHIMVLDGGGFDIGMLNLITSTPDELIGLGKDLVFAGEQLRQYELAEAEWPPVNPLVAVPDLDAVDRIMQTVKILEVANGHSDGKAA